MTATTINQQTLLDISGVMFITIDTLGIVTLVNKKACEIFGYDEFEMVGKNWFENFLPHHIKEKILPIADKILSGEIESAEYYENPILTKSGEERLIYWHNAPIKNSGGNIIGHLSSGEDITERKKTEQDLFNKNNELLATEEELRANNEELLATSDALKERNNELLAVEEELRASNEELLATSDAMRENNNQLHITKKSIEKSEAKYRLLATNTLDTIWTTDVEFNMAYVNSAVLQFLGYTPKEFIGANPAEFTMPNGLIKLQNAAKSLIENYKKGEITQEKIEIQQIKKDGTVIDVEITANLLIDNNQVTGFKGRSVDITEYVKAKTNLQESEENLKSIFNNMQDIYYKLDINGKILLASPSVVNLYKCNSIDEIIGKDANAFIYNKDENELLIKELYKHGFVKNYRIQHKQKNGNPIHIETNTNLTYDKNGIYNGVVGVFRDITERVKSDNLLLEKHNELVNMQEELVVSNKQLLSTSKTLGKINAKLNIANEHIEKSEAKYKQLSNVTFEGIVIHDKGIVLDTNISFQKLFGYTHNELIDKNIIELCVFKKDRDITVKKMSLLKIQPYEVRGVKKDGSVFWMEIRAKNITQHSKTVRVVAVRDISEQKQAQEALLRSEDQFSSAFHGGPMLMSISTLSNGTLIDINNNFINKLGYSRQDAIGKTSVNLGVISSYDRERLKKEIITEGRANRFDIVLNTKLGEKIDTLFFAEIIIVNKKPCMLAIAQDVTEQKKTDEQLQKLSTAVEQSANSIVITNVDGDIEYTNPAFTKITGYSKEEALGQNPRILNAGNESEEFYINLWETLTAGKIWKGELGNKTKYGELFWENGTITPVKNNKGEIVNYLAIKEDVTKLRKANEDLVYSEKKFLKSFQMNPAILGMTSISTNKYTEINQTFIDKLGFSRDETIGNSALDLNIVDSNFGNIFGAKLREQGCLRNEEAVIYSKSGEKITVLLSAEIIEIDNEEYIYTSAIDITERKKAEKEVVKLSTAVEQSASTIVITSPTGSIEYVNPAFVKTTGYSAEEAMGQNPRILKTNLHSKEFYTKLWQTLTAGKTWKGEFRNKKKNGTLYWEYATITPVKDEKGEIINYLAIKEDITKRKKAEEALLESEAKTKVLFNATNDLALLLDTKGRVITCNEHFTKSINKKSTEIIGTTIHQFFPKDIAEERVRTFKEIIKSKKTVRFEDKNGDSYFDNTLQPIFDRNNNVKQIAIFARDITKRILAQKEALNATIQAEEKERLRLARDIHDGVSPMLSALKIYIQSLSKFTKKEIIDALHKKLGFTIDETINSLAEISNNLSPHILQNFGLKVAMQHFVDNLVNIGDIKVEIEYEIDKRLNSIIATTIYRVTTELINNTIKYSKADKIVIKLHGDESVKFHYADNGQGFNYEDVKSKSKGMGLQNIVARIGSINGTINIDAIDGFKAEITIPLSDNSYAINLMD